MSGVDCIVIGAATVYVMVGMGIRELCIRCTNKDFLAMSTFLLRYNSHHRTHRTRLTYPLPQPPTHCVSVPLDSGRGPRLL